MRSGPADNILLTAFECNRQPGSHRSELQRATEEVRFAPPVARGAEPARRGCRGMACNLLRRSNLVAVIPT
jgi:hypothetical protein